MKILMAKKLCGKPARFGPPCGLDKNHAKRGERHSNGKFTWALRGKERSEKRAPDEHPRGQCPLLYVDPYTGATYEPHLCCQRDCGHDGRCAAKLPESGESFEWGDTWDIDPKRQKRNIFAAKRDHREAGLRVPGGKAKAATKIDPRQVERRSKEIQHALEVLGHTGVKMFVEDGTGWAFLSDQQSTIATLGEGDAEAIHQAQKRFALVGCPAVDTNGHACSKISGHSGEHSNAAGWVTSADLHAGEDELFSAENAHRWWWGYRDPYGVVVAKRFTGDMAPILEVRAHPQIRSANVIGAFMVDRVDGVGLDEATYLVSKKLAQAAGALRCGDPNPADGPCCSLDAAHAERGEPHSNGDQRLAEGRIVAASDDPSAWLCRCGGRDPLGRALPDAHPVCVTVGCEVPDHDCCVCVNPTHVSGDPICVGPPEINICGARFAGAKCRKHKGHPGLHYSAKALSGWSDSADEMAARKAKDMGNAKNTKTKPMAKPTTTAAKDPRCASKQQKHRCDLPTGHEGTHLARVPVGAGFTIKTWNASADNSWPCCSVKTSTKVRIPCWRPDEHDGGHRALVTRANGGTELAIWEGDSAQKVSTVKLHDAGAQLLAGKIDRAGRPAAAPKSCAERDGKNGKPCIHDQGHTGAHSDGKRTWPNKPTSERTAAAKENFDTAWKALEAEGRCDAHGGVQYERIRKLWNQRGGDIAALILREANALPDDVTEPDEDPDEIAADAAQDHQERHLRAYDEAYKALDLNDAEQAELRAMHRAAEETLDSELEISDLRTVLEQFRTVLRTRPGRDPQTGARVKSDGAVNKSSNIDTGRSSDLKHPLARLFGHRRHAIGALWSFADLEGDDLAKLVNNLKERDAAARAAGDGDKAALVNSVVLVEDVDENGMREWFVLDGWNRLRGCDAAGVRPRFVNYTGRTDVDSLIAYVDAVNDKRRHLTPGQRAAIAAEYEGLRQGVRPDRSGSAAKTQAELAKDAGISDRLLRRAKKVKDGVTPKAWEAVKRGRIAPDAALDLIDLPKAKQDELADLAIAGGKEMKPGKVKALARQEKRREVVSRVNNGLVRPMPMGPFGLIVADYPWKFDNSDNHEGSRGHTPYPPMEMTEIHAHAAEATTRAGDDCVLGLWTTDAHLPLAFDVIKTWGFTYQCPIIWDKVHVGLGIAGPRHMHEILLIAYKGKPTHTLNEINSIIRVQREPGHSKKPDLFYELLGKHCAGPRLELFAVGPERAGWECWGAETGKPDPTSRPAQKKSKILTASDERAAQGHA